PAEYDEEEEKPPRTLRMARAAAVAVLILGLVSALVLGGMGYFSDPEPAPPKEVVDKTAQPYVVNPKPSPMGERVPPPAPAEDPGATTETQPETPAEPVEGIPGGQELAGQQPSTPPVPSEVMTRIITSPPNARIVFDHNPDSACTTPCNVTLSSGRHTLAATMEGHRRALRIFELPQDSVVFINMEPMEGTVMVRSDPAGASIYVNGQLRKETTPAMLKLPAGRYTIEIVKEGLKKDVAQVDVKDSVITNLDVNWNLSR
ncbi:MAG: PEGA domain-containing protein, partial [Bryobacteraceae bacterium]